MLGKTLKRRRWNSQVDISIRLLHVAMKPTKSSVEVTLFNDASFAATDTESCSFFKAHRRLNFLLSLWTVKPHVRFLGLLFARYHELGGFKQQNLSSHTLEAGV